MNNLHSEIQTFRQNLPIFQHHDKIIDIVTNNLFCVITGDTGSGKSTQLPQYLLDSPSIYKSIFGTNEHEKLKIVVTQPRRIAAVSMANRICYERGLSLGEEIGYNIRFDDKTGNQTILRYVTDGILVRECLHDKDLLKYHIVVLDEAHERSLYTDILFALVKQAVQRRNGSLKLVITSATLNTAQFSEFFDKCPVLQMEGRCFPVEIKYTPILANKRVEEAVRASIRMHLHEGPGDILVFLTGSEECEFAAKLCLLKLEEILNKGKEVPAMMIFPLYGAQSADDQSGVFAKMEEHTRKVIFATNIAETSLTIDGVGFVIDCGYVKQKNYNPRTGMDALIITPISKVQAKQRAGRAGRTQPGKCLRLYSEQFFKDQMIEYTVPEILRVNLANTILTLKNMDIKDVIGFEYMEKPNIEAIYQSLKQLYLLDAIDKNGNITELGVEMCKFPLEPSYSKALISSLLMECEEEMLIIVSLLSTENLWMKISKARAEQYKYFEKKQREFIDPEGDHMTYLKIYRRWQKNNHSDIWCKENCLNSRALKMGENIRHQIKELTSQVSLSKCFPFYKEDHLYKLFLSSQNFLKKQSPCEDRYIKKYYSEALDKYERFKICLTTGFFYNSARRVANSNQDYLLLGEGNVVNIDIQSIYTIKEEYPDCVVFTELSGTTLIRGMMRLVTEIPLNWIQPYLSRMTTVDIYNLAGNKAEINKNGAKRKREEEEEKEKEIETLEKKKRKLEEAKARFLERALIKK